MVHPMRSLILLALLAPLCSCWSGGNRLGPGESPKARVGTVTTCSGTDAPLLTLADLPSVDALPDPFQSLDGTRITGADQWACRRVEIAAQAAAYELGDNPGKPASVTGSFDTGKINVTASDGTKTISFAAAVTLPTAGTAPYPAMIGIGGISIDAAGLNAMGVATMAWAWGVSRLIDAIEQTPAAQIDASRLGVTGCSRNGKGALIAGAFEPRIALTIPQESGSGGSASWRISDAQVASGTMVQTLSEITGENVWFRKSFSLFGYAAKQLPFDHHMIEGLVAPRALLIIENSSQVWLGNVSTYNDSVAGHAIWEALGIPDKMGVSQIGDHSHCMWNGSQQAEVTAYVQKFLIGGGTASTNVIKTDGGYAYDQPTWAPWGVPTLN